MKWTCLRPGASSLPFDQLLAVELVTRDQLDPVAGFQLDANQVVVAEGEVMRIAKADRRHGQLLG